MVAFDLAKNYFLFLVLGRLVRLFYNLDRRKKYNRFIHLETKCSLLAHEHLVKGNRYGRWGLYKDSQKQN